MSVTDKEIKRMRESLDGDMARLSKVKDYLVGRHTPPYMPPKSSREYRELWLRAPINLIPMAVNVHTQLLFVDGFRPGRKRSDGSFGKTSVTGPEWDHWQRSRLDARQVAIYREAIAYGHSFVVTEFDKKGQVVSRGLSPLRTIAFYEDPANDDCPTSVLHCVREAGSRDDGDWDSGLYWVWDETYRHKVGFDQDGGVVYLSDPEPHRATECPVTRFAMSIDLEGNTLGLVEPLIVPQDMVNQVSFDTLVTQTFSSTKVRTAAGLTPPQKRDENGALMFDDDGEPIYDESIDLNASRFLTSVSPDVKFDTLDETPLDGFIKAKEAAISAFTAISATPPHYMLGKIANLSAEALDAATEALSRHGDAHRVMFGEAWERVFRIAGQLLGRASANDFHGEVIWRDVGNQQLAASADALGKLATQLGVPPRGLWPRIPSATATEIAKWEELADKADIEGQYVQSLNRASGKNASGVNVGSNDDAASGGGGGGSGSNPLSTGRTRGSGSTGSDRPLVGG